VALREGSTERHLANSGRQRNPGSSLHWMHRVGCTEPFYSSTRRPSS
jgi:hypothetical protein